MSCNINVTLYNNMAHKQSKQGDAYTSSAQH